MCYRVPYCKVEAEIYHFREPSFSDAKSLETTEEERESDNSMVMAWLWNSMEPYVFG